MKILNRYTQEVIFECEKITLRETILEAIKNKANLSGADLSESRLCDATFKKTKISYRGKIVEVNFTEV